MRNYYIGMVHFSGNLEKKILMPNETEVSYGAKCKYMRIQRN